MMPASAPTSEPRQDEGLAGDRLHRLAQQPEGGLIVVAEEGADRDEAQHHRRQHQHQQHAATGEGLLEEQRQQEAHHELQQHVDRDHDGRGLEALPDHRVGQHLLVILKPDEFRLFDTVRPISIEAQAEGPEQRKNVHDEKHGERRRDQERPAVALEEALQQRAVLGVIRGYGHASGAGQSQCSGQSVGRKGGGPVCGAAPVTASIASPRCVPLRAGAHPGRRRCCPEPPWRRSGR